MKRLVNILGGLVLAGSLMGCAGTGVYSPTFLEGVNGRAYRSNLGSYVEILDEETGEKATFCDYIFDEREGFEVVKTKSDELPMNHRFHNLSDGEFKKLFNELVKN